MIKQRDEHGRVHGITIRVIFGNRSEGLARLGRSTAYLERSNLTRRLFHGRQVRKTLAYAKELEGYQAAAVWEDSYSNLVRPHTS